jgi:hypothetical protein
MTMFPLSFSTAVLSAVNFPFGWFLCGTFLAQSQVAVYTFIDAHIVARRPIEVPSDRFLRFFYCWTLALGFLSITTTFVWGLALVLQWRYVREMRTLRGRRTGAV